jgi:hypothetical protein
MTMRRVSCPVIAGESTKSPLTRHMSLGTVFIRVSSASAATAGIAPFVVEVGPLETLRNDADADPPSALQGISINETLRDQCAIAQQAHRKLGWVTHDDRQRPRDPRKGGVSCGTART